MRQQKNADVNNVRQTVNTPCVARILLLQKYVDFFYEILALIRGF